MWRSEITRRDLLEVIHTGRPWAALAVDSCDLFSDLPEKTRVAEVCWNVDPSRERSFPAVIVVQDDEIADFLAAANSSNNGPSPLSAFSRILTASEARLYRQTRKGEGSPNVIQGLLALTFSEAIRYADGRIQEAELTPAICKRTIAYGWAKALSNGVPAEQLQAYVPNWLEAQSATNSSRVYVSPDQIETLLAILKLSSDLYYGISNSQDFIGVLCEALIHNDSAMMESAWNKATKLLPFKFTLRDFSNLTREDRTAALYDFLDYAKSKGELVQHTTLATCGFLASQISPGTFEHMSVLRQYDAGLTPWYSFMAGLQQPRGILGFYGGLGSRLQRDVNRLESFGGGPVADIAFRELRVLMRAGIESISRRLGHSNEIEVEVIPLVTCSFRFQASQQKQVGLFDTTAKTAWGTEGEIKERQLKSLKKILAAAEELSILMGPEENDSLAKSAKRPRKR